MKVFTDLVFNMVIIFTLLFFLSFMQIAKTTKKAEMKKLPVKFMITVEWPDKYGSDVDSWTQLPSGDMCWFRKKDVNVVILDRDDLGWVNSTIHSSGQDYLDPSNREITTIRAYIPGKWIFNIHMYQKLDPGVVPVTITILKMNPKVTTLLRTTKILTSDWQQFTICSFYMSEDGMVKMIDTHTQFDLVDKKLEKRDISSARNYYPQPGR